MRILWTNRARRQLSAIVDYILLDDPSAAEHVYETINHSVDRLATFSEMGRPGRVRGTRELVIPGLPYIIPYRLQGQVIEVLAIFHAARRWPEGF